jgi:hypothetical protein
MEELEAYKEKIGKEQLLVDIASSSPFLLLPLLLLEP